MKNGIPLDSSKILVTAIWVFKKKITIQLNVFISSL